MKSNPINSDFLSQIALILENELCNAVLNNKYTKGYDHVDIDYWIRTLQHVLLTKNPTNVDKDVLRKAWLDMLDKMLRYEQED